MVLGPNLSDLSVNYPTMRPLTKELRTPSLQVNLYLESDREKRPQKKEEHLSSVEITQIKQFLKQMKEEHPITDYPQTRTPQRKRDTSREEDATTVGKRPSKFDANRLINIESDDEDSLPSIAIDSFSKSKSNLVHEGVPTETAPVQSEEDEEEKENENIQEEDEHEKFPSFSNHKPDAPFEVYYPEKAKEMTVPQEENIKRYFRHPEFSEDHIIEDRQIKEDKPNNQAKSKSYIEIYIKPRNSDSKKLIYAGDEDVEEIVHRYSPYKYSMTQKKRQRHFDPTSYKPYQERLPVTRELTPDLYHRRRQTRMTASKSPIYSPYYNRDSKHKIAEAHTKYYRKQDSAIRALREEKQALQELLDRITHKEVLHKEKYCACCERYIAPEEYGLCHVVENKRISFK